MIGQALIESARSGELVRTWRKNAISGLVVGIVALPLSMGLSIAVGLPPQYGLYTAIVGGMLIGLLGGSPVNISGPTAAFVVILAPIVAQYGFGGLRIRIPGIGFEFRDSNSGDSLLISTSCR
jgi:SulP family sulfate permease